MVNKLTQIISSLFAISLVGAGEVMAGHPVKEAVEAPYEANRGLLTTEGPTGLFINPTSATLPKGAFTAQYCFSLTNFEFKNPIGHQIMAAYGVTDWLEIGAIGDFTQDLDLWAIGPLVRLRLLKHEGFIPQFSIGGYGTFGDRAMTRGSVFAALTERFEVNAGPIKSVAFDAGVRQTWTNPARGFVGGGGLGGGGFGGGGLGGGGLGGGGRGGGGRADSFRGYFGLEVQLPARFYVIGEIATQSSVDRVAPWAAGIQWRAGGVNISTAAVESGDGGKLDFFFGVGTQF